jgi:hypothetical protein
MVMMMMMMMIVSMGWDSSLWTAATTGIDLVVILLIKMLHNSHFVNWVSFSKDLFLHNISRTVFLKLQAVADHFIGGRRTRRQPIFSKISRTQKWKQVNRKNIIQVVKITVTTFFYTLI